ncbi:MAG: arginine--tRNA ligase [Crocinitomicaceae bacterium]|nr:arginine--tRNA ligase [Crocinitomicaceae bacterium]
MINVLLAEIAVAGVVELYGEHIDTSAVQIQETKKEFVGDLTIVVFPLLKLSKKSPSDTATELGNYISTNCISVTEFNVVKGFLNLEISNSYWLSSMSAISNDADYGYIKQNTGKTFMVEYSSPNTNKPLHLGHLRNIFLGDSVTNILKANGHQVYRTQIINDRGIHICKSMYAWLKFGNNETPETTGLKGDKLVGKYYVEFDRIYKQEITELIAAGVTEEEAKKTAPSIIEAQKMLIRWESKDPEIYNLWKKMNSWVYEGFSKTYQSMNVEFDRLYYESDTYIGGKEVVEKGVNKGLFYRKEDSSVWVNLAAWKLDDKLLLRADGTSVYMTQDIGTAIQRHKDFPGLSGLIYTVGNEQEHHFKVLFAILETLGFDWAKECSHLSYGMVDLPSGKMKSREGTVVDADDLIATVINDAREMTEERGHLQSLSLTEKETLYNTIGLGGLKYYLLRVDPKRGMMFDPKESIDLNGNTGPFIQYAFARIQSLLKKAGKRKDIRVDTDLSLVEKKLIIELLKFPQAINESGTQLNPSLLINYTYDLVKQFNSFYQSVPILKEVDKDAKNMRIELSRMTSVVIDNSMRLLGIDVPAQM